MPAPWAAPREFPRTRVSTCSGWYLVPLLPAVPGPGTGRDGGEASALTLPWGRLHTRPAEPGPLAHRSPVASSPPPTWRPLLLLPGTLQLGCVRPRSVSAGKAVAHCQRALQTMSRQEEVTSSCHTDRAPAAGSGAVLVRAVYGEGTFQTGGLRSHLPRTAVFILVAAYLRRLWPWVPKYLEAALIRQIPLSGSYQTPCN